MKKDNKMNVENLQKADFEKCLGKTEFSIEKDLQSNKILITLDNFLDDVNYDELTKLHNLFNNCDTNVINITVFNSDTGSESPLCILIRYKG
jgi:hypothetical protein